MTRTLRASPLLLALVLALAACSNERLHVHATGLVLQVGDTARIRASTLYQPHHDPQEVAAESLAFAVSDPGVASIGPDGVLTARQPGRVRVSVRTRDLEDSATVVVRGPAHPGAAFRALDAGALGTCALGAEGRAFCWGVNIAGELGTGSSRNLTATTAPVAVRGEAPLAEVGVGEGYACALTRQGEAYCWGGNLFGQLGEGTDDWRTSPARVKTEERFASLAVGEDHACALTADGRALCWGGNYYGALGDGTREHRSTPTPVRTELRFSRLAAGNDFTCGLARGGAAHCWGSDGGGQLGSAETDSASVPIPVSGGHRFTALASGGAHTCGITAGGAALCWGANHHGQLGTGQGGTGAQGEQSQVPVPVASAPRLARIVAGEAHTCALAAQGEAWCWGEGADGQLGDGGHARRTRPVRVAGGIPFRALSAGRAHTCGLAADGAAWCWGRNETGELGSGSTRGSAVPVRVAAPLP